MKIAVLSDLHLAPGRLNRCGVRPEDFTRILDHLDATYDEVIVGGDLYDLSRPLRPGDWEAHRTLILREFGELIERLEAYPGVFGNHDRARQHLGVPETLSRTSGIRLWIQHGQQFDGNLKKVPGLEASANYISGLSARLGVQGIGEALGAVPAGLERLALKNGPDANTLGAAQILATTDYDVIITGHTHLLRAVQTEYGVIANSGAWESEPQWVGVDLESGELELVRYRDDGILKTVIDSRPGR